MSAYFLVFAIGLPVMGLASGFVTGLLGVGGGSVIVPALFLLFPWLGVAEDVRMHLAVGTSLAAIVPTAFFSARAHQNHGSLDLNLLKAVGPAIFVGVVLGAMFGGWIQGPQLAYSFAAITGLVAIYMAFKRDHWILSTTFPSSLLARAPIGFAIGASSVLMGGGTIGVPTFAAFGIPIRRAIGAGAAIGLIVGIPGCIAFIIDGWGNPHLPPLSVGYVNLLGLALIAPATIVAAPWGVRAAHRMNPDWLRKAFSVFMILSAGKMVMSAH